MYKERACAVIPAYNEQKNLEKILKLIPSYLNQTIIVDDGSTDMTSEIAESYMSKGVILQRHEKNRGKAIALKTGIEKAIEIGYEIIVTLDGDGQHSPKEIPRLIEKLEEGNDLVIGSRNFQNNNMPLGNMLANILDSKIVSKITKTKNKRFAKRL